MSVNSQYVQVALPVKMDCYYTYSLPDSIKFEDVIYRRVLVNFNGRMLRGLVIAEGDYQHSFKIKPIMRIIDHRKVFEPEKIQFARWIADYYFSGIGEVLSLMVPKGIKPAKQKENKTGHSQDIKVLTPLQQKVTDGILLDMQQGIKKFYLYGVTGSGKTEIYIKLIQETLKKGKSVIFLVPEIALSYQTLNKLEATFGSLCAIMHSHLKGSVRLREYLRLFDGEAKIAIGPRSALFAPLNNIGLIIIDEENEGSYKSEESPRFHARSAAFYLSQQYHAAIVLGSATPSIESWYFVQNNYFKLYSLNKRYGNAQLPEIEIIEYDETKKSQRLSAALIGQINKRLQNGEQVVLLQNRRGFANLIKCKNCQTIIKCPRCNISLTYHKAKLKLICHHCSYQMQKPEQCIECHSSQLIEIGAGTERIEDEMSRVFSHAIVQRLDYDVVKSNSDYKTIIKKMENKEIDILVGTQMIAKGLHFPDVKFVGIVNADMMLNIPDYKAAERTFALITQVAGRAGREGERGQVMIQTINPDHYSIISAETGDFESFYETEIEFRKMMDMPPFTRLLRLVVRGADEESVQQNITEIYQEINLYIQKECEILGPVPCIFAKINHNFRYQILLKSKKIHLLQKTIKTAMKGFKLKKKNYLEIDVDPINLF